MAFDLELMTPEERKLLEAFATPPKISKYRAVKRVYNGRLYDSIAESERAGVLDLLMDAGVIDDWVGQVTITLGDITYRVDFVVIEHGRTHAEDVKGFETVRFKLCKRLWLKYGPCPLHVIKRGNVEIIQGAMP
jgi:Protein of unknown function (DUF1064)